METSTLGPWFTDLLKVLAVVFFLVGGIEKSKKLFGRNPPFQDELNALRKLIAEAAPLAMVDAMRSEIIPRSHILGEISRIDTDTKRLSLRVETVAGMITDAKNEILEAGAKRIERIEGRLDIIADSAAGTRAALEQFNRDHVPKK